MAGLINSIPIMQGANNPAQQTANATNRVSNAQSYGIPNTPKFGGEQILELGVKVGTKAFQSGIFGGTTQIANGAAQGAVTAGGGSYTTGAGLAGSASPINLAGAGATKPAFAGFKSGLKGGLTTAGIGIAAGFLGDKIFGGKGGTGASIGSTVGFAAGGPIGAAIGGLLGGFAGGLFGGSSKRTYFGIKQSNELSDSHYIMTDTPLGKVGIYTTKGSRGAYEPVRDAFIQSDTAVAALLDEQQLSIAKQAFSVDRNMQGTRWTKNPQRAETVVRDAMQWRYSRVASSIDSHFGTVFNRVVKDGNAGDLVDTFARIGRDNRDGAGVFAGTQKMSGEQSLDHLAKVYGLADQKPLAGKAESIFGKPELSEKEKTEAMAAWEMQVLTTYLENNPNNGLKPENVVNSQFTRKPRSLMADQPKFEMKATQGQFINDDTRTDAGLLKRGSQNVSI